MEERLRKFAHLVDAGTFTKAAAELHISQPALSAAVAKLERELKVRLFVRGSRPLTLTPAGKLAYQSAKELEIRAHNLRQSLAELANQPISLRIGMIDSVADALFASGTDLAVLEGASVSLVVNNSRYLTEAVERGDLDIAFITAQTKPAAHILELRPVATEPLVVVANAARHMPTGLLLPDFISYDQASNTARLVLDALRRQGMTPQVSFYSTSPEIILRLVLLDKGIAALPYLMVRSHIRAGKLQRLGGREPWLIQRNIVALKRRDKDLPQALQQLTSQTAKALAALFAEAKR